MGVRQFSKRTQSWAASETKTSYAMQEKIMWHAFWLIIALLHRVSVLCFCFVDSCRNMFISPTHVSIFPVNRWLRWHGRAPRQYKAGINYHVCNMSENVIYMFFICHTAFNSALQVACMIFKRDAGPQAKMPTRTGPCNICNNSVSLPACTSCHVC